MGARRTAHSGARRPGRLAAAAVILVFALVFAWVMAWFIWEMSVQILVGPRVHAIYGFSVGSPFVRAGRRHVEVGTLHPRPGGLMAEAGVQDGDILDDPLTFAGLYRRLDAPPGTRIRIRVLAGGDGPPLPERPARMITLVRPGSR
jgi:hypothetical protein